MKSICGRSLRYMFPTNGDTYCLVCLLVGGSRWHQLCHVEVHAQKSQALSLTTPRCSYNRINGTHSCNNAKSLNNLLKTELNFQGSVMSDWGAQWNDLSTAMNGLDIVRTPRTSKLFIDQSTCALRECLELGSLVYSGHFGEIL